MPKELEAELAGVKSGFYARPLEESSRASLVFAACDWGETAREDEGLRNDIYTHFLIEGLNGAADRNADGAVTATEAHDHARRRTFAFTQGRQRPSAEILEVGADPVVLSGSINRVGRPELFSYNPRLDGFTLKVDGEPRTELPGGIAVPPGRRTLELTKGGAVLMRREVEVASGDRLPLEQLLAETFPRRSLSLVGGMFSFVDARSRNELLPASPELAVVLRLEDRPLQNFGLLLDVSGSVGRRSLPDRSRRRGAVRLHHLLAGRGHALPVALGAAVALCRAACGRSLPAEVLRGRGLHRRPAVLHREPGGGGRRGVAPGRAVGADLADAADADVRGGGRTRAGGGLHQRLGRNGVSLLMGHTLHIAMAVLLALGLSGCGELVNEPFRTGTVHGQLAESDQQVARVSLLGAPGLSTSVTKEGQFTLQNVPAGPAELFIVASASRALRVPLTVPGGQSLSLGELVPLEASFLSLRVKASEEQLLDDARVSLVGTPLQQLALDEKGERLIGPIPDGCYTLSLSRPDSPDLSSETCVSAGETKEVKVNLPEGTLHCTPNGQCFECLENSHCGPGLTCRGHRCEGSGAVCMPCDGDWKCRSGTSCQTLPEGSSACVERCEDSDDCKEGFACQSGRCLPDTAQFANGCQAYRGVGTACEQDTRCRSLGLVQGLCLDGACTYPCSSDDECPDNFSCEASTAGRVCQPRD